MENHVFGFFMKNIVFHIYLGIVHIYCVKISLTIIRNFSHFLSSLKLRKEGRRRGAARRGGIFTVHTHTHTTSLSIPHPAVPTQPGPPHPSLPHSPPSTLLQTPCLPLPLLLTHRQPGSFPYIHGPVLCLLSASAAK